MGLYRGHTDHDIECEALAIAMCDLAVRDAAPSPEDVRRIRAQLTKFNATALKDGRVRIHTEYRYIATALENATAYFIEKPRDRRRLNACAIVAHQIVSSFAGGREAWAAEVVEQARAEMAEVMQDLSGGEQ